MILHVFLVILSLLEIGFAHPRQLNHAPDNYFVFPTDRTNSGVGGRIIGGQEAEAHAYPYQVGLYCHGATTNFCGGSLVSNNYVLTAAHCVDNITNADLIFGAHAIEEKEETQVRQSSDQFIIHPEWDKGQLINDIALVKLSEPVEEDDYIKIIKITNAEAETFAGERGIIAGWGRTTNAQQGVSPRLRYLESDIMTNEDCKNIHPYETVIQPTHLCLIGLQNDVNVGTCNGDSGGPLAVGGIQVGLVSFGYSDCEMGKPSVFTRLTEFKDWIEENSDVKI